MISITTPASKSMSHRALIAAALAGGESLLHGVLDSDDIRATRACLAASGVIFRDEDGGAIRVFGVSGYPQGGLDKPVLLDVGESGTTCRLLTGALACGTGLFEVRGRGRMHDRPIGDLATALIRLGVNFVWQEKTGYPPFIMRTSGLPGGRTEIDLGESSQYLSGLLLAAPAALGEMRIEIVGEKVVSWPYVALTLQVLKDFGAPCRMEIRQGTRWVAADYEAAPVIAPGRTRFVSTPARYKAREYTVEGDWSNASYFLAAGAVGKSPVTVTGLRPDSLQGDRALAGILTRMGADVTFDEAGVRVSPSALRGADLDMGNCPDIVPTVAVLASLAEGQTRIHNVAHLRIKECDRLDAMATELNRAGGDIRVLDDGLVIRPAKFVTDKPIHFCTYGDHRVAMSLAILELAGVQVHLDNPACVAKSFPTFWEAWGNVRQGAANG